MKNHSIYVDQARYATSVVTKYLDTSIVKANTKFYKTTLPSYIIFTKADASTSEEKVEKLTRESTFTTDLALVHLFIYFLQEWI